MTRRGATERPPEGRAFRPEAQDRLGNREGLAARATGAAPQHDMPRDERSRESGLGRVAVVLHQPQSLVNIAGAVRAMSNMGLQRLVLVEPAEFDARRIGGIAHRTEHIVESVVVVSSLEEALASCIYVAGTSARPRTAQRNYHRPRDLAPRIVARAAAGPVALLFGREDRGLSNAALDHCHDVLVAPTSVDHPSLNLAQAVLLVAYEVFLASAAAAPLPVGKRSLGPASADDMEEMYAALEAGLHQIDFFKARKPESVMRTLRTAFSRTTLDAHEARLLRSVGYEVRNQAARRPRPSGGAPSRTGDVPA